MARRSTPAAGEPAPLVRSFPPRVAPGCRVLVLGSVPSVRSLAHQQAYAHPHNLFWPLMGELFDAGPEWSYAQRIERLNAAGVGLWDVLCECRRAGSLDSAIETGSEVPNAIPQLLARHAGIRALALNGGKALALLRRHVLPALDAATRERVQVLALPSTSPAAASITAAEKRRRWRVLLDYLD